MGYGCLTSLLPSVTRHAPHRFVLVARSYDFGYLMEEVEFARGLSFEQFVSFYTDTLLGGPGAAAQRALAIWVTSADSTAADMEIPAHARVLDSSSDLAAFHASQKGYARSFAATV